VVKRRKTLVANPQWAKLKRCFAAQKNNTILKKLGFSKKSLQFFEEMRAFERC
jgi:hypothetical protein